VGRKGDSRSNLSAYYEAASIKRDSQVQVRMIARLGVLMLQAEKRPTNRR
jgi:hypothetical protein